MSHRENRKDPECRYLWDKILKLENMLDRSLREQFKIERELRKIEEEVQDSEGEEEGD